MSMRSTRWKWLSAMLAISLILFVVGCEDDDDPAGPSTDPDAPVLTSPANGSQVDLKAIADSGEDFLLNWNAVEGASSYEVQIAAISSFSSSALLTEDATEENSFVVAQVNNFTIGGAHYWRVRSVLNDEGTEFSAWSQVYSFVPVAEPRQVDEIISGTLTSNKTLTTGNTYLLRGGVFVASGATLTIQPGVTIYGEAATDGMLVISRGGKIDAQGTREQPIVFTSDRLDGSRGRGDWGGVIINGAAPINTGAEAFGEGDTGPYGGTNPTDNSGIMSYCRIEFAGREISPDNELNGLALQGVGSGTTIEYIQIHMNQDDGIEFFGGTVNAKYIYVTGAADDSFDWTDGWIGMGQFWVAQQYSDDADCGFECDNSGDNNTATPYSNPTIHNFTAIGTSTGTRGMIVRAGTKGKFYNGIITGFGQVGYRIDGTVSEGHFTAGELALMNCILDNTTNYHTNAASGENITNPIYMNEEADPQLGDPFNTASPDFSPVAGGLAAIKAVVQPTDPWFDQVDFVGGVDPDDNWVEGWTISDPN